jgi:hypothetical protein
MQQKACEFGLRTEAILDRYLPLAASPSRRSDHGRVRFSARTLLFLVDPEKSCLGARVLQHGIAAKLRRTNHKRANLVPEQSRGWQAASLSRVFGRYVSDTAARDYRGNTPEKARTADCELRHLQSRQNYHTI